MNDPKCRSCGLHHRSMIACPVARRLHASGNLPQPGEDIKQVVSLTPVNTASPIAKAVNTDRHSDGYMRDYMQKRRAKQKINVGVNRGD